METFLATVQLPLQKVMHLVVHARDFSNAVVAVEKTLVRLIEDTRLIDHTGVILKLEAAHSNHWPFYAEAKDSPNHEVEVIQFESVCR